MPVMTLRPVGVVRSEIKEPSLVAKSGDLEQQGVLADHSRVQDSVSEILVYDEFAGILDGIEDFSHVLILYWAHLTSEADRSVIKVHPMGRRDLQKKGVFATCSPVRPNPICVTAVPLVECREKSLVVKGLDAVDGSPVIDVKPYNPGYYAISDARVADWMTRIVKETQAVKES